MHFRYPDTRGGGDQGRGDPREGEAQGQYDLYGFQSLVLSFMHNVTWVIESVGTNYKV